MNRTTIAEAYLDCFLIAELCRYFALSPAETKKAIRDIALTGADRIKHGPHFKNLRMIASKCNQLKLLDTAWPVLKREFEKLEAA